MSIYYMEEENNNAKSVKSILFAERIIKLYKFLKDKDVDVLRRQVLRSGTSIGANIAEADFSESKSDFKHKISIALKEANETLYWLKLLYKGDYITDNQYGSIKKDCSEIIAILLSITKTISNQNE